MRALQISVFKEPDIGDQITAVALEPGKTTQKLVSKIKKMGHDSV